MAVAPAYTNDLLGVDVGYGYTVPGDYKSTFYSGTVGAADTYVTGGFALAAASVGLAVVLSCYPVTFSTGHWGVWLPATGKVQVFSAAGTELVNASAGLQSATFQIKAIGR